MPGGNGTLAPLVWQPVPGAPGAYLYPLIRKTDIISSNSYLIATPAILILIDPGGLHEQADLLSKVIGECRRKLDRPVLVLLTHAHVDHFAGMLDIPAFTCPENAVIAVQEQGGESLERGDAKMTQADLLEKTVSAMKVGLRLFPCTPEEEDGVPVLRTLSNGAPVTITGERHGAGGMLPSARLEFKNGPGLEIFHTPGHSPDSICIRTGSLLFIGDLLFAASPGVAGLCGWDRDALIRSLDGIQEVIAGRGISTVCPGHGHVVAGGDAARILAGVRTGATALAGIAELNRKRAEDAAAYAEDCMEEVSELFTVMAGRLYFVSYVMDELGESELAGRMNTLIAGDTVDELLEAFAAFAREHHRKNRVSIHLALKAGQVMGKLERSLKKDELRRIIDPTLVNRAGRLLSDYTAMLRGFTPPSEWLGWPVVPLVEAVSTGLTVPGCSDEDFIASADDEKIFLRLLLSRIGARPLLKDVAFSLERGDRSPVVTADRGHFCDLVTYLLEDLVGTGSDRITLQVRCEGQHAVVILSGNTTAQAASGQRKNRRFLHGLAERAGGTISFREDSGMRQYCIHLDIISAET